MNISKFLMLGTLVAGMFLTMAQTAAAGEYDIRGAGPVSITTAEGTAIVEEFTTEGSTGTGTFKPFLQVNQLGGYPKSPVYGYSTNLAVPNFPVVFYTTEPTYTPTTAELPVVEVAGGSLNVSLDETDLSWSSDGNLDDVLDPGETWTWTILTTISVDTTFSAIGTGIDSLGNPVTVPVYPFEYDEVFVEVEQDFTRTWGFWKTHLFLVQYVLDPINGLGITPIDLGDWGQEPMIINNACDYMGLMWSKQAQNSDGGPREKIDAARIHTAHQALAAIMNYYMPNGATIPVSLTEIADILTNGNVKQIRDLGSQLAAYNESGEDVALDPSLPPTGKISGNIADPQGARDIGAPCEDYWDTPEATKGGGKPPK